MAAGTNDRPLNVPASELESSVVCAFVESTRYTRLYEMPIMTPFLSIAMSVIESEPTEPQPNGATIWTCSVSGSTR